MPRAMSICGDVVSPGMFCSSTARAFGLSSNSPIGVSLVEYFGAGFVTGALAGVTAGAAACVVDLAAGAVAQLVAAAANTIATAHAVSLLFMGTNPREMPSNGGICIIVRRRLFRKQCREQATFGSRDRRDGQHGSRGIALPA